MNETRTRKHKSNLVILIYRMIFFKLLDFLFCYPFFFPTSLFARHLDALAINLHVLFFGFDTFCYLQPLRLYLSLFIISPIKGHYITFRNITTK
jgi:hypothetical protein